MRASVDTSALLLLCAGEFVTCALAVVKVTTATIPLFLLHILSSDSNIYTRENFDIQVTVLLTCEFTVFRFLKAVYVTFRVS